MHWSSDTYHSHTSLCAVFTAEKTDWVCLFVCWVSSPCLFAVLCLRQWKTTISRIIKWLKEGSFECHPSVCICALMTACMLKWVNMHQNWCLDTCVNAQASACLGKHPWQAGTKADVISCVSVKAGATIQSFMLPHNTSWLPVNRLAGTSSSTVLWQTKYFAASVSVLARMRALLLLPSQAVIE